MTSELRAAAERVIAFANGGISRPYGDVTVCDFCHESLRPFAVDSENVAMAMLTTHPTDGGEAISEAKCRELGFKDADGMLTLKCPSGDYVGVYFVAGVEYPWIYVNGGGVMFNVRKKMSHLRHLLAALGCECNQTTKGANHE